MNRLISTNLENVTLDDLPPAQRKRGEPVRLLFLSTTYLGFQRYFEQLVAHCAADDEVDAVHIQLQAPLWQKVLGKGVPGLMWSGWDWQGYRHLLMWRRRLNAWLTGPLPVNRFDAVHILTQGNAPDIAFLKDYLARAPRENGAAQTRFALNIDATARLEARELGYSRRALRPMIRAERQMFAASDLIVCRNKWCSSSLQRDYHVDSAKVQIARNSMLVPQVSRQDHAPRAPSERVRIVFVGNHWKRKCGPQLLQLHQTHFAERAELHVCSARAKPDRTARNVIWHGAVPHATIINELLPQMDIFVLPTRNDMHPWAVLEAASVGLPVVSSRLAGIPEMVVHEKTGLLCPPNDWPAIERAIARLIEDADERERMGRAGRLHVQQCYDPQQQFGGLLKRLKQLGTQGQAQAPHRHDE